MPENYSVKVLNHYRNSRNFGILKGATHTASELNPLCGDEITVYLNVRGGKIKEMKYEARGCALMIASASALAERIGNGEWGIEEVRKLGEEEIEKLLDVKVGNAREGCVMLVLKAINHSLSS